MKHTNAKSHRLLLNTTPEGRARIQALTLASGAATESALLRQAFDFYAMLHPRLLAGDEVFMRSADRQMGFDLDISATWDGPTEPSESQTVGIRQRLELKLDPAQREQLDRMVELGAAPTLTALAGEALTAYGYYVRYRNQGMLLYLRSKDGAESLVVPSIATEKVSLSGADDVEQPMGIGRIVPKRVPVLEVLRQEEEMDAEVIVIDTPFDTTERFLVLKEQIVRMMLGHHFKQNITLCQFVRADKEGVIKLSKFIRDELVPYLSWEDFTDAQKVQLEARIAAMPTAQQNMAAQNPVWALVEPLVIEDLPRSSATQSMAGRYFDSPRWYAKLRNQEYWGYEFLPEPLGVVTQAKTMQEVEQTFMNPMDPEKIERLLQLRGTLLRIGWEDCEPLSSDSRKAPRSRTRPQKTHN